jgi:competence protein ComEA
MTFGTSRARDVFTRIERTAGNRRDLLVAVGGIFVLVVFALVLMARGAPAQIAPPAVDTGNALPPSTQAIVSPATTVVVHVAGAVVAPGVYSLPLGARVTDAIAAAGGAKTKADLNALNLAAPLSDGQKIEVLRRGATASQPGVAVASSPTTGAAALVSINNADETSLDTIPGIGPVTAQAILKYRAEIGSFNSIDQLIDVPGIGPATLESIRPYVTL